MLRKQSSGKECLSHQINGKAHVLKNNGTEGGKSLTVNLGEVLYQPWIPSPWTFCCVKHLYLFPVKPGKEFRVSYYLQLNTHLWYNTLSNKLIQD